MAEHGIQLDTIAAEVVAEQLRTTSKLCLDDFFVDRKVEIKKRPFMRRSQILPRPERAVS
jgi:hypothetical protein